MPAVTFRILDRDSSRKLAREQGFSEKNFYYYTPGEDEQILMKQLHPKPYSSRKRDIRWILREGGSCPATGIRIFCHLPPQDIRQVYLCKRRAWPAPHSRETFTRLLPLRSGLTTGTCAAAAVAATWMYSISTSKRPTEFPVVLPNEKPYRFPQSRSTIFHPTF